MTTHCDKCGEGLKKSSKVYNFFSLEYDYDLCDGCLARLEEKLKQWIKEK